ncbi:MAG: hypothetical protein ABS98_17820 [Lysobacteraceae bacterium SCN 69-48]|nr:MAG: hypothetical protein ABS98_17820 [Xanthomonadaceae bacterium SCN 69-48]
MSKRARKMALMGFVTGALSDVVKTRAQARLEEAEARKEERLAAIRAEERSQDFAQRRELTQYELGERQKMAETELSGRRELTQMELSAREKISAADNAARAAEGAADRKSRERVASISSGPSRDPGAKLETYVDDNGKPYSFNTNDPASVRQFMELSGRVNLRPDYASRGPKPYGANPAVPTMAPQDPAAGPARISSPTELASLPSGTRFIAPDGSLRVKP